MRTDRETDRQTDTSDIQKWSQAPSILSRCSLSTTSNFTMKSMAEQLQPYKRPLCPIQTYQLNCITCYRQLPKIADKQSANHHVNFHPSINQLKHNCTVPLCRKWLRSVKQNQRCIHCCNCNESVKQCLLVLCDTRNCSHDNDTVLSIEYHDTTAIPEVHMKHKTLFNPQVHWQEGRVKFFQAPWCLRAPLSLKNIFTTVQNFIISSLWPYSTCALHAHFTKVKSQNKKLEMCHVPFSQNTHQLMCRAIAWYWNRHRHDTWRYCSNAIYWDLFDTGIETLVLTISIKVSHNTSAYMGRKMPQTNEKLQ